MTRFILSVVSIAVAIWLLAYSVIRAMYPH